MKYLNAPIYEKMGILVPPTTGMCPNCKNKEKSGWNVWAIAEIHIRHAARTRHTRATPQILRGREEKIGAKYSWKPLHSLTLQRSP